MRHQIIRMNKGIYVATLEPHSGKSIITLGVMQNLLGRTAKVAYFRPIIDESKGEKDNHIDTILSHFKLNMSYEETFAFTRSQVIQNRNAGKKGDTLDQIIAKYKKLEETHDFVLVEGTDFLGEGSMFEFDWNVNICKNLGIPAVLISSGEGKSMNEFIGNFQMAYNTYAAEDVEVIALAANKIQPENRDWAIEEMQGFLPQDVETFAIPMVADLAHPSIDEICTHLGGEILIGEEKLGNLSGDFQVGAMQLRNFLTYLKEKSLVILPGDRADLIMGTLQAHISANYPQISGMILTGGLKPEASVMKLIKGLPNVVPVISVKGSTFEVANRIGTIKSHISPNGKTKIQSSLAAFQKYISIDSVAKKLISFENQVITPRMFQYDLVSKARKEKKKIVLPEAFDDRILVAAARLSHLDLVDLVLLGKPEEINKKITQMDLSVNFNSVEIVNPSDFENYEDYAQTFYELRKHKNVTIEMARDIMRDLSYFGTMMIYKGDADGMVSGAAHTTQHTIRPALQFIKTKKGCSIVSSIFFMCLDDRVSVFGDCAINPNPNAEQLAEIAISSAQSSMAFGITPRIAMLSYSSGASGKGEDVDKVRAATEIVRQKRPDLKIEGPIQYDAAVDMNVGKSKLPDSEVAGQANVLIFPDLNTGNNTYKAVQRETGALAIGPMLQGLNKPVNDLSRGCTTDDIYNTVILTAIQAQGI